MTVHRQVPIEWGDMKAEVDEDLAPLVLALWRAGIYTSNSCQENRPGIAWIQFLTTEDAKAFLNIVAEYPAEADLRTVDGRLYAGGLPFWETPYGRVVGCGGDGDWEYDVHPCNYGVEEKVVGDELVEKCIGPADFDFSVSVRFPRADLPLVLERVLRAVGETAAQG